MVGSSRVIFVLSAVCSKGLFFVLLKMSIRKLQLNNLALPYRKLTLHEFEVLEIHAVYINANFMENDYRIKEIDAKQSNISG